YPFHHGTREMFLAVCRGDSKECATYATVPNRSTFTHQVGEEDQPVGAGRQCCSTRQVRGVVTQRREFLTEEVAEIPLQDDATVVYRTSAYERVFIQNVVERHG